MLEAKAQGMGVAIMRPLTSGTFQKLMQTACPEIAGQVDWHRMLLNYVLSNQNVDVAVVGMRRADEVERNNAISDAVGERLDLVELHHRFVS